MRIAFDVDDTILFYTEWLNIHRKLKPTVLYPQSSSTFYDGMPSNHGAIWAIKYLQNLDHDIIFVTQPPDPRNIDNISSKFKRLAQLFGDSIIPKIYIAHDKSLVKCDILVDDKSHDIQGELIIISSDWTENLRSILKCVDSQ